MYHIIVIKYHLIIFIEIRIKNCNDHEKPFTQLYKAEADVRYDYYI